MVSLPMVVMANSRISNTSSFRAMKSERKFSACAKWWSNREFKHERTVFRIDASFGEWG